MSDAHILSDAAAIQPVRVAKSDDDASFRRDCAS
jgi:hypothetical protein